MKSVALKRLGGYTIVEVLIVLAVTGIMLASALALVGSLRGESDFSQAMFDIKSKIDSEITSVNNSTFPDEDKYNCQKSGSNRPQLSVPAGGTHESGTSGDCVFLGKALWLKP